MRALPGLLLLSLIAGACSQPAARYTQPGPAERYVRFLASDAPVPGSLPFHREPAVGQWASYREGGPEGGQLITYRILAHDRLWTVQQIIDFGPSGGVDGKVVCDWRVDDDGVVRKAYARWLRPNGELERRIQLQVAPPDDPVPYATIEGSPDEDVAGLPTRLVVEGQRRYWFTDATAYFAQLRPLSTALRPALVRVTSPGGTGRELLAQGNDVTPDPSGSAVDFD